MDYAEKIAEEVFEAHKHEKISVDGLKELLAEAATKGYNLGFGAANA